jgi:hypothetical protein
MITVRTIFCSDRVPGKDDSFAARLAFDKAGVDYDARSVSITQCGSVTAIAAFAEISTTLGIRWCAVTDEDLQEDGTVKPNTQRARESIEKHRGSQDKQVQWPVSLEHCLGVTSGKATPEVSLAKLSEGGWQSNHPQFTTVVAEIAAWVDPAIKI